MYYMMQCFSPDDADHAFLSYVDDDVHRMWQAGARFTQPPPEPVRAVVESPGVLPELADDGTPLMTKRLWKALGEAGVTNIDVYRAEIFDPSTKQTHEHHVAFNIVGAVAAAELAQSAHDPSIPWFESVALNEQATRGALLFRLAESVNAIVVHKRVKQHIEAVGITTLTFVPPEQWAG